MKYIVTLAFWDVAEKKADLREFQFDSLCDALQFAMTATDNHFGIERIDASVKWTKSAV